MHMKYARKLFFCFVAVLCTITKGKEQQAASSYGLVWAVMINPPEQPINDETESKHILQVQVCNCVSTNQLNVYIPLGLM